MTVSDRYRVGVDLGGTKTEAVLLDGDWQVQRRTRVSTPRHDYNLIVETIASLVQEISSGFLVERIGVCTPGTAFGDDELISNSNTQSLQGRPLRRDIQGRLGMQVIVENDANCFALAEALLGAGAKLGTVFGVIMGTGVGGGIVIDGRIHGGRTGIAGEWGHHTLHRGGNPCYCGMRGCVETYLSGPALEHRWEELTGRRDLMPEIVSCFDGQTHDRAEAFELWRDELLENFGYALADVVDILDPDAVVLGGGLSNIEFLYDEGADSVRKKIFSKLASDVPILKNKLGDSAGVIGACLL